MPLLAHPPRVVAAAAAAFCAAALVFAAPAAAPAAAAPPAAEAAGPGPSVPPRPAPSLMPGPSVVEVPFRGELQVSPATGWLFADCGVLTSASDLVVSCAPEGFTVAAPNYDPGRGETRVAVPLVNTITGTQLQLDYVLRLARPDAPDAPDTRIGVPVRAGGTLLVPLSALSIECTLCTPAAPEAPAAASIEVVGVDPASAGVARVTGTHLVFAASPDARGAANIALRVSDDVASSSKTFFAEVQITADQAPPIIGLHLTRPAPAAGDTAPIVVRPDELAFAPGDAVGVRVADCGGALASAAIGGRARCTDDGSVEFTPSGEGTGGQFGVQLTTETGRLAFASVTFGGADAGIAGANGADRAALQLALPAPATSQETPAGVTVAFGRLIDEMGVLR